MKAQSKLLFKRNPGNYTPNNFKKHYIDIVEATYAYRKNYNQLGQLQGNVNIKWRSIIRPELERRNISTPTSSRSFRTRAQSSTGYGLIPEQLTVTNRKSDYIYWDDPNELVNRLRVLISSKNAGYTCQEDEIMSIVEELREDNLIE